MKYTAKRPAQKTELWFQVDELTEKATQLERVSPEEMLETAEKARELAVTSDYPYGIAKSLALVGKAYVRLGNLNEASEALARAHAVGEFDDHLEAEICNNRGIVSIYLGMYDKAFSFFQRALNLAKSSENGELEARLLNNIGEIYRENKDFTTAQDYYHQSIMAGAPLPAFNAKSVPVVNLAATYMELNDLENAERYAHEAFDLSQQQNDQMVESVALQYLGVIARRVGEWEKAQAYLSKSLEIYRRTKELIHAAEALLELYKLYWAVGQPDTAMQHLREALRTAEEADSLSLRSEVYGELASVYESLGDLNTALFYHKQHHATIKSIDQVDREQNLRAIEVQIAADESFKQKEVYRELNQQLDQKAQELEEAYRTLQTISDVGKNITSSQDLNAIFAQAHQRIKDLMVADAFGIGLYDQESDSIVYRYLVEDGEEMQAYSIGLDSKASFAVSCFKQQKGLMTNSLDEDVAAFIHKNHIVQGQLMHAVLFQPLVVEGETIGIVSTQSKEPHVYSQRSLAVLGMLASYFSIAIQNAQKSDKLRDEIRQREHAQQELEELNAELASLSNRDGLTDIANRRRLDQFLQDTWYTALRQRHSVSAVMIDVDFLKEYNDHYGHLAGDEVIKQIAQTLKRSIHRRTDLVARYGGDEFVVILGGTDADGAEQTADRIRADLKNNAIPHITSHISPYVTLSIGVATMSPQSEDEPTDLIAKADQALYAAKQAGRNCIRVAT